MDYGFYKMMHNIGLMLLFLGLGGVLVASYAGVKLAGKQKIMAFAAHGVGLLLVLVAGFGMLARLGITSSWPTWVFVKIGVWVIMALMIGAVRRYPSWITFTACFVWGGVAAYMALYKPF